MQTIELVEDKPLEFSVDPNSEEELRSEWKVEGMFNNSDVNKCPILSYDIVDSEGNSISSDLVSIKNKRISVNQSAYKTEMGDLNLQIRVITDHGEPVFKQLLIKEKSQCEISRGMKMTPYSKCTIDQENDGYNDERFK